ncbi:MAG: winged helix-turn-helix transcriptional regulator [Candidatus Eremiobacteraeota bacterium]|nr:winged helix-turn-helix transcriptional regulator [Candidatus Eremiobacteraeota bacterium]MBV9263034.1 winged helix-turn-helix transcriptional regulator [Candidatus Eremiobacteraeota bacterium]
MFGTAGLDSIFSALGDPTRRRMVERLARGPLRISDVAAGFAMSQPAISKHVKILERSGLVRREVVGREHRLRLSPVAMESASSWIERQRGYWTAAFDRLDAYLKPASAKGRRKKWAPTS